MGGGRVQVGAFEKDPNKVAQLVKQWVASAAEGPDSEFNQMVRRAKALGTPESLARICKDLVSSFLPFTFQCNTC